jgi:hypothetical protein
MTPSLFLVSSGVTIGIISGDEQFLDQGIAIEIGMYAFVIMFWQRFVVSIGNIGIKRFSRRKF